MQDHSKKQQYRSLFGHTDSGQIYMNHAAISPLSKKVTQAIQVFLAERHSGTIENFGSWMETVGETRRLIGQLIKTNATDRIIFTGNTSDGISAVARGLSWQAGDEIILNTLEFPANIQPFRILEKQGVKLVYAQPDKNGLITPDRLAEHITPKTKMISISAVQYLTGFRADLQSIGELCKTHNLLFVVDGIQGLGAMEIDVEACGIDAIATGCHKWLMAPMGTGFLYLSENLASRMKPFKTGWLSVENPWQLSNFEQNWLPVPKHLETGTFNAMGIIGLQASLQSMLDISLPVIENEILSLTSYLAEKLTENKQAEMLSPAGSTYRSGIISFSVDRTDDYAQIVTNLKEKNIMISAREGYFRIAPHFYNTTDEIDIILESLLSP